MKCLILAGGFATRLYPLTINKAKALLEFRGKPVISHVVERVPRNIDILAAVNRKFEVDFKEWRKALDRPVELCIEEAVVEGQKKGAVSAIDFWIKAKGIKDDLLVIAADNYFEFDLGELLAKFDGKHALVAAYEVGDKEKACEVNKACQVGLVTVDGPRIARFDEKPDEPTSSIIATGIYVLPSRVFPLLSQYAGGSKRDNLGSFISYFLDKEEVRVHVFTGVWVDIGDEINRGRLTV